MVVIDSPPLLAVTDAAVLATKVDGVILVVKPGLTKISAARHAVEQLQGVGANIVGVVLNEVDFKQARYRYSYYKGYYQNYEKYYGEEKVGMEG
jgi:polysaccharide biosynthesis transport protein